MLIAAGVIALAMLLANAGNGRHPSPADELRLRSAMFRSWTADAMKPPITPASDLKNRVRLGLIEYGFHVLYLTAVFATFTIYPTLYKTVVFVALIPFLP
jgi:hypothetical protein